VWNKFDSGSFWTEAGNYGLSDQAVTHLEWDIVTSGRLYAVAWNTLRASTDYGSNWTALVNPGATPTRLLPYTIGETVDPKPFAQLRFSPFTADVATFYSYGCKGIYYSFNGTSFSQHYPFAGATSEDDNCIGNIAVDVVTKRVYFSTLKSVPGAAAHVYRSTCAWAPGVPCLTWELANTGLPTGRRVASLVSTAELTAPDRLTALVNVSGSTQTWETTTGTSWTLRSTLSSSAYSPRPLIYVGSDEMFHGNVRAFHSSDRGANWSDVYTGSLEHPDVRAIYASPVNLKFYTANDGTIGGSNFNMTKWNWTPGSAPTAGVGIPHTGIKAWQAYYAGVVPAASTGTPRRVFVGAQDNGAQCADNALGPAWTISGSPPFGDAFAIQFAKSAPNRGYARGNDESCFLRTSNAQLGTGATSCALVTWTSVCPAGGAPTPYYWSRNSLAIDPTNEARVVFAFLFDIGVSTNSGDSFTHRTMPAGWPTAVHIDNGGAIYVGTADHGLYQSVDSGASWTPWGLNGTDAPAYVYGIASAPTSPSATLWMATSKGLYRKIGAGSWALVTGGQGYIVNHVTVDPNCPTRVYAALGFGMSQQFHRGGIRLSTDNGTSWTTITAGNLIHDTAVADVQVDSLEPRYVYAASYGRGFWTYDWGSSLPACVP